MTNADMDRLKSDASGNTGLSAVLAEAVEGFSSTDDAVRFLASRGFDVTASDLAAAASDAETPAEAEEFEDAGEDGYVALMRFVRQS
ncbi:hypothetical protein [Xanthobacter sp. 91]|uniref:hypothetical protein n=1 Tax=Xanthobacter sp. 91 TaxID=1117244 RepID=UPI0004975220|nr:hypothetical protein [Xanthobacter sp. 91]